jgi:hypothetical protein
VYGSGPVNEAAPGEGERRAQVVLALLVATIALGVVLLVAFDPDVQTVDAGELVDRRDDARAFLVADYAFVVLYAVLSPLAIWRFGARPARLAAPLLAAAGLVDATENTLLLAATGTVSEGAVDAAHALAVPKIALFVAGALLAMVVNVRAVQVLRR